MIAPQWLGFLPGVVGVVISTVPASEVERSHDYDSFGDVADYKPPGVEAALDPKEQRTIGPPSSSLRVKPKVVTIWSGYKLHRSPATGHLIHFLSSGSLI